MSSDESGFRFRVTRRLPFGSLRAGSRAHDARLKASRYVVVERALALQELHEERADFAGPLLLHPVSGAVDEVDSVEGGKGLSRV